MLGLWWLGGILSIIIPVIKWNSAKNDFYNGYGRYAEYENNQRANDQANGYDASQFQAFNCKWWQYKCRQKEYMFMKDMEGNNGERVQFYALSWYTFVGGKVELESRDREMMGLSIDDNAGAIKFVYGWSIALFVLVLLYGTYVYAAHKRVVALNVVLAIVCQYSLLMLLVLPQGIISTNDREMENSTTGWYGQMAILMVYFNFAQCLFGVIFIVLSSIKSGADAVLLPDPLVSDDDDGFGLSRPKKRSIRIYDAARI